MKIFLSGFIVCSLLGAARAAEELQTITVRPGETLWNISETYLKDPQRWSALLTHNRLPFSDPSTALPGMQLTVPAEILKEEYRAAKLVSFTRDVLFRRTGSSDWGKASLQMDLFGRDTVYTMAASSAAVRFHTGEMLLLTPNTLVVLRPPGKKTAEAEMLSGELFSRHSRVVARGAVILPRTADAEFSARMKGGVTTVVSVTRGVAEVEAHGKKVEVRKGYVTEVKPNMAPSLPVELAAQRTDAGGAVAAPALAGGSPDADASATPDALDSVNLLSGYQLQVAKDREFSAVVLDRTYPISEKPDLARLLTPGAYFMRVAKIDLLGYKGRFSAPRPIKI